ncbi:MAG: hypothetical protein WCV93_05600 [Candidatus Shapirobacteria bacterium]|jgi:hypothetical protein
MARFGLEFASDQRVGDIKIDPSRRITTGTTTNVDRGVIPDRDGGSFYLSVAVKSVRDGVDDSGMLASEIEACARLSKNRITAQYVSPFLVSDDKSRLVMFDLPEFGYTEKFVDFMSGLTLPEQRILFLQLGKAAFSFLYGALYESGMVMRDIFGSDHKGLWVGKDDRESQCPFDFVFTDFGLWEKYGHYGEKHASRIREMFLVEENGTESMFLLFPFIRKRGDQVEVTDPVLGGYVDQKTGLSLGEILTSVLKGGLDEVLCDKKYGSDRSYNALAIFFDGMLHEIPMETLRIAETEPFSVEALVRNLAWTNLTPTQLMALAAPFGMTGGELRVKLIELYMASSRRR